MIKVFPPGVLPTFVLKPPRNGQKGMLAAYSEA